MISYPKSDFKASEQTCAHSSYQMCQFLAIFPHFRLLISDPLTPTSTFIDKNVNTRCYCNNIYREKAIPGCFHPIVQSSPAICLKILFLAIYPHLRAPHGLPFVIFSFFSYGMCWVEYSFIHFKRKIGNFFISIHFFFILFAHFSERPLFGPFTPI